MLFRPLQDERWFEVLDQNKAASTPPAPRIPCLDGLRAVAILLVVFSHSSFSRFGTSRLTFGITGTTGVTLFFIISGFLITSLLLDEKKETGTVSLRNFYIRRVLRIFPAYYCYLAFVMLLRLLDIVPVSTGGLLASTFYVMNFAPNRDWLLAHTWSLSVEEQFYLVWPLVIFRLSNRHALRGSLATVAAWPVLRLVRHGFLFAATGHEAIETAALDTILYGAILALAWREDRYRPTLARISRGYSLLVVSVTTILAIYEGQNWCPPAATFLLPILRNLSMTGLVWWCIHNADTAPGRLLQARPVVWLGVISYSLYLWQEPFFLTDFPRWISGYPQHLFLGVFAAMVSYYWIEQPMNRLRSRFRSRNPGAVPSG